MDQYHLDWVVIANALELVDRSAVRWRIVAFRGELENGYAEGRLFFGEGRIYGRFVRATKGKISVPICMAVYDCNTKELGLPANTGETSAKLEDLDHNLMCLGRVTRLP